MEELLYLYGGFLLKIFISLSVPQAFILSFAQSVHHLVNIKLPHWTRHFLYIKTCLLGSLKSQIWGAS